MKQSPPDHGEFTRVLGPFSAMAIVIGAIIGVGIFLSPNEVAKIVQSEPNAMLAWGVGGLIALLGALTFAELGGVYSRNGGQYEVLRDAFGPLVGFVFVFCNATAVQAGAIAIIAIIAADNLWAAMGMEVSLWREVTAVVLIVGLAITNYLGVRWGSLAQNLTVICKLLAIVLIVLLAAWTSVGVLGFEHFLRPTEKTSIRNPDLFSLPASLAGFVEQSPDTNINSSEHAANQKSADEKSTVGGESNGNRPLVFWLLFAGVVPTLFAFGGWQHALWIGGEVKQPTRNIPLAIIGGVLVVVVAYLSVNWAYFHLLGFQGVVESQALAADAVASVWPILGTRLVAAAVSISATGVLNTQLLSGPRLLCGMARDGKFFSIFSYIHSRRRTPYASIWFLSILGLVLLLAVGRERVGQLMHGVVLVDSVSFLATGLALIFLRTKRQDLSWPFRTPWFPLVPLLFCVGEFLVITGALLFADYMQTSIIGVGWIVAAVIFYAVFFRKRAPLRQYTNP